LAKYNQVKLLVYLLFALSNIAADAALSVYIIPFNPPPPPPSFTFSILIFKYDAFSTSRQHLDLSLTNGHGEG
jgi:hypothetical protein